LFGLRLMTSDFGRIGSLAKAFVVWDLGFKASAPMP